MEHLLVKKIADEILGTIGRAPDSLWRNSNRDTITLAIKTVLGALGDAGYSVLPTAPPYPERFKAVGRCASTASGKLLWTEVELGEHHRAYEWSQCVVGRLFGTRTEVEAAVADACGPRHSRPSDDTIVVVGVESPEAAAYREIVKKFAWVTTTRREE